MSRGRMLIKECSNATEAEDRERRGGRKEVVRWVRGCQKRTLPTAPSPVTTHCN